MKTKNALVARCDTITSPSYLLPDNGAALLAATLIQQGSDVLVYDWNTVESIGKLHPGKENLSLPRESLEKIVETKRQEENNRRARELIRGDFDVIGFKLWTGDSFRNCVDIASIIKQEDKKQPIIAGGPHVDAFKEKIYDFTDVFDVLVYGEGEPVINTLTDTLSTVKKQNISLEEAKSKLTSIPNLIFKLDNHLIKTQSQRVSQGEMDTSPVPVYSSDIYPAMEGDQKIKIIVEEMSRGCPYSCSFCGHADKSGRAWRVKPAEKIVKELSEYADKYNTRYFRNGDSNTPPRLIQALPSSIKDSNLEIFYAFISHVNFLEKEYYKPLADSGCQSLFVGIESGDEYVREFAVNKGIRNQDVLEKLPPVLEEMALLTSIIFPLPGETEESKNNTIELLQKINPTAVPVNPPIPTPNSRWYEEREHFRIEFDEKEYMNKIMLFSPKLFLPPSEGDILPCSVDGKPYHKVLQESGRFVNELENLGLLTQVIDDIVLMASLSGKSTRAFRDGTREYLRTGDQEAMQNIVKVINSNAAY